MANEKPQNLQNHARFVPPFHMFALPVFMVNVGASIYYLVKAGISFQSVFGVLMAFALLTFALYARLFALTVQDRVIRLEMRLRFASDAELPVLARKVLDDKMNDRKAIKRLIKDWQPDYLRA